MCQACGLRRLLAALERLKDAAMEPFGGRLRKGVFDHCLRELMTKAQRSAGGFYQAGVETLVDLPDAGGQNLLEQLEFDLARSYRDEPKDVLRVRTQSSKPAQDEILNAERHRATSTA